MARAFELQVGGAVRFHLPSDTDIHELKLDIAAAIQAGGGWLDVQSTNSQNYSLYLEPGVPVILEERELPTGGRPRVSR